MRELAIVAIVALLGVAIATSIKATQDLKDRRQDVERGQKAAAELRAQGPS